MFYLDEYGTFFGFNVFVFLCVKGWKVDFNGLLGWIRLLFGIIWLFLKVSKEHSSGVRVGSLFWGVPYFDTWCHFLAGMFFLQCSVDMFVDLRIYVSLITVLCCFHFVAGGSPAFCLRQVNVPGQFILTDEELSVLSSAIPKNLEELRLSVVKQLGHQANNKFFVFPADREFHWHTNTQIYMFYFQKVWFSDFIKRGG